MGEAKDKAEITELNPNDLVGSYTARVTTRGYYRNLTITYARVFDGHFLLYETSGLRGCPNEELFGVVDSDKPLEADRRLYERAREFVKTCDIKDKTRHAQKGSKLELSVH